MEKLKIVEILLIRNDPKLGNLIVRLPDDRRATCYEFSRSLAVELSHTAGPDADRVQCIETLIIATGYGFHENSVSGFHIPHPDVLRDRWPHIERLRPHIELQELKARINDLGWLLFRDADAARGAVGEYLVAADVVFDPEHWVDYYERVRRATQLAFQLNDEPLKESVLLEIEKRIISLNGEDPLWLTYKLSELLILHRGSIDKGVVKVMQAYATKSSDFRIRRDFWRLMADNANRIGKKPYERKYRLRSISVMVKKAKENSARTGKTLISTALLQDAIQDLSKLPRTRIIRDRLSKTLADHQRDLRLELKPIGATIPTQPYVSFYRKHLSEISLSDVPLFIASQYNPESVDSIRQNVIKTARKYPILHLFSGVGYDGRSKLTAKKPALPLDGSASESELVPHMIDHVAFTQKFNGSANIPILISEIVSQFPLQPTALEETISRSVTLRENQHSWGLRASSALFTYDLIAFFHFAIPLMESMLRNIHQIRGGTPFVIDPASGTQREPTLGQLLKSSEVEECLGTAICFDLSVLLDVDGGAKLRHNFAHGLLDEDSIHNPQHLYLIFPFFFLMLFPQLEQVASISE